MAIPGTENVRASVNPERSSIRVCKVPNHLRMAFLPQRFGRTHALLGEALVYEWMRRLCSTYRGGYWEYQELSNGGFYMALDPGAGCPKDLKLHLCVRCGNDFEGDLSNDAAGIVATLFALNQMVWNGLDHLEEPYYWLRDFAIEHAECGLILAAID